MDASWSPSSHPLEACRSAPHWPASQLTPVAVNLVAISGGILVFHDRVRASPPQIVGRAIVFCLVIAGAAWGQRQPATPRDRTTGAGTATRPVPFIADAVHRPG